jgi:hypothetical protein
MPALLVATAAANAILLTAFIAPLYVPLTPADYAALISSDIAAHDVSRAANLYASAVRSYPESRAIRALADQTPRLLLGGTSTASRALLWEWLARGNVLRDRDALLMLAHEVRNRDRDVPPPPADTLNAVMTDASREPDLAEPAALMRMAVTGSASNREASRAAIDAGRGIRIATPLRNGEAVVEGFTVHPAPRGGTQVIVYFRPQFDDSQRRLWLHAYPVGSGAYIDIAPAIAPTMWTAGALTWALFELPPGAYTTYFGTWVVNDLGTGVPLGVIP